MRLLRLLGVALKAAIRLHIASEMTFIAACLLARVFSNPWLWAATTIAVGVAANTLFVFTEGVLWAYRIHREAQELERHMAEVDASHRVDLPWEKKGRPLN